MGRVGKTKKAILLNSVLLILTAAAAAGPRLEQHVPNEIIVKFHAPTADALEDQLRLNSSPAQLTLSKDLDELNARYKVKSIKPLIKNFRKRHQQLKALRTKSKTLLSKIDMHILRRLQRAPKGANVPDLGGICKIQFDLGPEQSLLEAIEAYQSNPDVEYAELNYIVSICKTPDDPLYGFQWALHNTGQMYPESGGYNHPPGTPDADIDAPAAWQLVRRASDIVVAVLDTGVDYNHRDLAANMWTDANGLHGYDFVNDDNDPRDDHGHGTHCAGIIAAEGNNGLDVAGVCWEAQIMALKSFAADGDGETADAVKAVYYAVENGADIISNSWGGFVGNPGSLENAFDYAYSQGVIAVASAGNYASELVGYPAIYEHVIAVAATNSNDERPLFSSYGDDVDIAAPGVDILSLRAAGTSAGTTYTAYTTILSGTSMACPHVSGAFALILSLYHGIDIDQARDIIMDNADYIDPEISVSGRLNLYKAVREVTDFYAGTLRFDRDLYSCSDVVQIWLSDLHLAGNGTQDVNFTTSGGDAETVTLVEIVTSSSSFYGTISTESNDVMVGDGILQLSHGETFTAVYKDEDDGTGDSETVTDTGLADCEAPVISDIEIDAPGPAPTITFETNEPTIASVLCALECGGPYVLERSDLDWANRHTIRLNGVSPFTDYFFTVQALDLVGNETIDDNVGQCYPFTTTGPSHMYVPDQYPTIQEAIYRAWDTSTIWAATGIYTGEGNRDIDFLGKVVTVSSMDPNDPAVVAATIIDCNATEAEPHRAFYFRRAEEANSVLTGFTITNGYESLGGAIFCFHSKPTIANCIIRTNKAETYGGAISCIECSPAITHCFISANAAKFGGGISCSDGSTTIANCTLSGNKAESGGGIVCYIGSPTIINCTVIGNSAAMGGGVVCLLTDETIRDSIIRNNVAGMYPQVRYFTTPTYSCIQDWTGNGQGNIDVDPCFVDAGYWDSNGTPDDSDDDFWVQGDYHLKSQGWRLDSEANQWTWDDVTSRCIDAGNPGSDLRDEAVTLEVDPLNRCGRNLRINMGAYAGTAHASMPPYGWAILADLTNDGTVDFRDLALWTQNWLTNSSESPSDLNRDAVVDTLDFAIFTQDWFLETTWHE